MTKTQIIYNKIVSQDQVVEKQGGLFYFILQNINAVYETQGKKTIICFDLTFFL